MDQKGISQPPKAGFQDPPAYEQYQNFAPEHQNYAQNQQNFAGPQQAQQQFYPQAHTQPQVYTVITGNLFGPDPATLNCPSCHNSINTRIDYESSTKTHLMAGLICLLFWPCFCLPYMMDTCKNANHYCPHCSAYLGTYRGA